MPVDYSLPPWLAINPGEQYGAAIRAGQQRKDQLAWQQFERGIQTQELGLRQQEQHDKATAASQKAAALLGWQQESAAWQAETDPVKQRKMQESAILKYAPMFSGVGGLESPFLRSDYEGQMNALRATAEADRKTAVENALKFNSDKFDRSEADKVKAQTDLENFRKSNLTEKQARDAELAKESVAKVSAEERLGKARSLTSQLGMAFKDLTTIYNEKSPEYAAKQAQIKALQTQLDALYQPASPAGQPAGTAAPQAGPPEIKTKDEWAKLPPGTVYMMGGQRYVKGGGGTAPVAPAAAPVQRVPPQIPGVIPGRPLPPPLSTASPPVYAPQQ